ncbi:iron-sulfur cluster assembly protein [Fistulifera solaris]|jgi:iron-sulfur cluster assembly protein|uniref:Iron-sulfur cluster assembly protein n=1 Tax=Fistulifera solaris TaxID=1519565 RepID=A0A1Z5KSQ8_FISSO|nr:iron-sulfur cluster assembly protein [Fistulifera solaris]|eukprot:GAX29132.1 iron-sulfur cluster assembly protein [Fistulifera solaris]
MHFPQFFWGTFLALWPVTVAWILPHPLAFRTTLYADTTQALPLVTDYEIPEDAVVMIKPAAMKRLRELRQTELKDPVNDTLILRMGVRSGGCSGMSYVMDFSSEDSIQEDDVVDEYADEKVKCVVDAKSMLYLYGLELDYSTELIGGGFKFFNPNAEESCGCGSSFGV